MYALFVCLFLTWMHRHDVTASINVAYESNVGVGTSRPIYGSENAPLTAVTAATDSPKNTPTKQEKMSANQKNRMAT